MVASLARDAAESRKTGYEKDKNLGNKSKIRPQAVPRKTMACVRHPTDPKRETDVDAGWPTAESCPEAVEIPGHLCLDERTDSPYSPILTS